MTVTKADFDRSLDLQVYLVLLKTAQVLVSKATTEPRSDFVIELIDDLDLATRSVQDEREKLFKQIAATVD